MTYVSVQPGSVPLRSKSIDSGDAHPICTLMLGSHTS